MSRLQSDTIPVKPSTSVYTALAAIAFLAAVAAVALLFIKGNEFFQPGGIVG